MIKKSKQDWTIGKTVKVGFLNLIVKFAAPTPGDYMPDAYILSNLAETQLYKFVPHNGLEKIDFENAKQIIEEAKSLAQKQALIAIQKASKQQEIENLFNQSIAV